METVFFNSHGLKTELKFNEQTVNNIATTWLYEEYKQQHV